MVYSQSTVFHTITTTPICNLNLTCKRSLSRSNLKFVLRREKLKTMGKTSKRKFAQLASVFSRRKGAKEMLGHAPENSNDNLLLNADPILAEDELANRVSYNHRHSSKADRARRQLAYC